MRRMFLALAIIAPVLALAHEGHGHTEGYTIIHYFSEPVHMAATVIGVVLATFMVVKWSRRNRKKNAG